jgi:hypothetical protein
MSTASQVRDAIDASPVRSFLAVKDIPGASRAVESAFSRLAAQGEVIHVRHGLYWKGPKTRVGMPLPWPLVVALEVGGPGSGPAGLTAAHELLLTTQVPSVDEVAVPGRAPSPVPGVVFTARSYARRLHNLTATEVALLEVLRTWPAYTEGSWEDLVAIANGRVGDGSVRLDVLNKEVPHERSRRLRDHWQRLAKLLAA